MFARPKFSYANVVATVCLVVLLTPTAAAAVRLITGAQIKDGSITSRDVANGSLTGADIRNRSIGAADLAPGVVRQGAAGERGPAGEHGPAGANGSPDTPAQVRDKLADVDGPGSGIDADTVDGLQASSLAGMSHTHFTTANGSGVRFASLVVPGDATLTETTSRRLVYGVPVELRTIQFDVKSNTIGNTDHYTFSIVGNGTPLGSCSVGDFVSRCTISGPIAVPAGSGLSVRYNLPAIPLDGKTVFVTWSASPR